MGGKLKVVHYLNQFFGQIGGEDKAHIAPIGRNGTVGPGSLFQTMLDQKAEIIGTVICGDNYFNESPESAKNVLLDMTKAYRPDIFLAGPAFNAGRYGMACGGLCELVSSSLGIPAITGMFRENPAVELYKKSVYIVETTASSAGMKDAAQKITSLALKLAEGKALGTPQEESYIPRGIRKNYFASERGAGRAIKVLLNKMGGVSFATEYAMPPFDRVEPVGPLKILSEVTMALITSGGIVPKGNPDHIESSSASKYGKYKISQISSLSPQEYESVHGGYDNTYANDDPNRVLPLDALRTLENEGVIGKLYPYYYATVGNGTSVANARKFAQGIIQDLLKDNVRAVIITST